MTATLRPVSNPNTNPDLDALRAETRRLWREEPAVAVDERESIVVELIELDRELERVALRHRWSREPAEQRLTIDLLAEHLDDLRHRWRTPG